MIPKRITFHAERANFGRHVNLWALADPNSGRMGVARPVAFEIVPDDDPVRDDPPMLSCTIDSAQCLMDALWACGLRPTEGSGSAGAMAATQEHLKDLRRVAFTLLERQADVVTWESGK